MPRSVIAFFLRLLCVSKASCPIESCNRDALDTPFSQRAPRDSFRGGWQSHIGMTSGVALSRAMKFNSVYNAELFIGSAGPQRCNFPRDLLSLLLRPCAPKGSPFCPCIPCSLAAACVGRNMATAPVKSHVPVVMVLCFVDWLWYVSAND